MDEKVVFPFKHFGLFHLFSIVVLVAICLIIREKKNKIVKLKEKTKQLILKILAIVFLGNMLGLYIFSFYYHIFDYKTMLPLHLCYLANYFYIYVILFKKKELYEYCYFLNFIGPLIAIIFLDLKSIWESYNFYLYIISHHLLVIVGLLTFYMYPKRVNKKTIRVIFIVINILYISMKIFNYVFKTNYFFSEGIPLFIREKIKFLEYIPPTLVLEIVFISLLYILNKWWVFEYKNSNLRYNNNVI